jgi:hypothetical protein
MSSTWQVSNYRHEQVDMGAWDSDSDEEEGTQWPPTSPTSPPRAGIPNLGISLRQTIQQNES